MLRLLVLENVCFTPLHTACQTTSSPSSATPQDNWDWSKNSSRRDDLAWYHSAQSRLRTGTFCRLSLARVHPSPSTISHSKMASDYQLVVLLESRSSRRREILRRWREHRPLSPSTQPFSHHIIQYQNKASFFSAIWNDFLQLILNKSNQIMQKWN